MYTTIDEEGRLNNYAPTTRIYYAEYPAVWQQRRYAIQGVIAAIFVSAVIGIAFVVSTVS